MRKLVLKEGGSICELLPLTAAGMRDMVKSAYENWSFESTSLTNKLAQRQLSNVAGYSYAEDGLVIFNVVQTTMTTFVNTIYSDESAVLEDYELQNWVNQVSDITKGKVKDFPKTVRDRAGLINMLSRIFHQFVFERCMINYSQYDHMAFMPTFPTYISKWETKPLTNEDVIRLMDREKRTSFQLHGVFVFCYELVQTPSWDSKNLSLPLLEILETMQKQFQIQKTQLRDNACKRPTPYKYFILHTGFLK